VTLAEIRREIDRLDQRLLETLGRRFALVRRLGELKAGAAMAVRDAVREADLLRARLASGRRHKLDRALVIALFREILDRSVRIQSRATRKNRRARTRPAPRTTRRPRPSSGRKRTAALASRRKS
jgi:chorismate mutase